MRIWICSSCATILWRPSRTSGRYWPAARSRILDRAAGQYLPDVRDGLHRIVAHDEQIQILIGHLVLPQDGIVQPCLEARPVLLAEQDDREVLDLPCLGQREGLEQLVQRPEPTGKHHEALRVLHEHGLAHEEVPEL